MGIDSEEAAWWLPILGPTAIVLAATLVHYTPPEGAVVPAHLQGTVTGVVNAGVMIGTLVQMPAIGGFELLAMIDDLVVSGRKTAQAHYGARGWVVHHLSDIFGFTYGDFTLANYDPHPHIAAPVAV